MSTTIVIPNGTNSVPIHYRRQPLRSAAGTIDVITKPDLNPSPIFYAKERYQLAMSAWMGGSYFDLYRLAENETDIDPGSPTSNWLSTASHTSFSWGDYTRIVYSYEETAIDELLKGRELRWGQHESDESYPMIDRLFDRDYVLTASQTMVSFGIAALRAVFHVGLL